MTIPHCLAIPYRTQIAFNHVIMLFVDEHSAEIAYDAWKEITACKIVCASGYYRGLMLSNRFADLDLNTYDRNRPGG